MPFKYTLVSDTLAWAGYDILENPQEILQAIKAAGYDGVDPPGGNPEKVNARQLKMMIESAGLEIPQLLPAWAFFHAGEDRDLAGLNTEARERGIRHAHEAIDLAVALGAKTINVVPAQPAIPQIPFPDLPIATLRSNFVESLRRIFPYARERGITVVFEPCNCYEAYPGLLSTLQDAVDMIRELGFDNAGIQPDVFHMNISEADVAQALRNAGPYIKHFHMNETNRRELGTGHGDHKTILKTLKEIAYAGYLAIYLPLTTQEVFQLSKRGYGRKGPAWENSSALRPDLRKTLERPINYLKALEAGLESAA